jgi:hypothetical protein
MRWLLALTLAACASCTDDPNDPLAKGEAKLQLAQWRAVQIDSVARASLRVGSRTIADRAPVPVLVPRSLAAKAMVMSEGHWAAVHIGHEGLTISIQASDLAFIHQEVPPLQGNKMVRGAQALVTENEGIWSASWHEHGVAFTMEVECARPDEARCADDSTLLALTSELAAVGGVGVAQ